MLRDLDLTNYRNVWILPRYTDMRQGIPGLSAIVRYQLKLDVFDEHSIFLFCGRRRNRMKALVYEGSGFTLLYHRINENCGRFHWPMTREEVMRMTPEQYSRLINGFTMDPEITLTRRCGKQGGTAGPTATGSAGKAGNRHASQNQL